MKKIINVLFFLCISFAFSVIHAEENLNWAIDGENCNNSESNCTLIISNSTIEGNHYDGGVFSGSTHPWSIYSSSISDVFIGKEGDIIKPTDTSSWFKDMNKLKNIDLSFLDTSQTTNMTSMFENCTGLISLDLRNFDTSANLYTMYMFNGCSNLQIIVVSDKWDVSHVPNNSYMFSGTKLVGMNGTMYNDTYYMNGEAYSDFIYSYDAPRVDLPDSPGLLWNEMPSFIYWVIDGDNCDTINGKCSITFSSSPINGEHYKSGITYHLNNWSDYSQSITSVNLGGNNDIISTISAKNWFSNMLKIKTIDLSHFNSNNLRETDGMFEGCENLSHIDLSHFNTSKVKNMNSMFKDCHSLVDIDLSNFDTSEVTDMGGLFYNCENLKEIDVSNFDTSKVRNLNAMFKGCSGITKLNLSNFDTRNVVSWSMMLSGCNSIEELDLSNFYFSGAEKLMLYMSQEKAGVDSSSLTSLKKLNLSNSEFHRTMESAFSYIRPEEIILENADATDVKSFKSLFANNSALKVVNLNGFKTQAVTTMNEMFKGCSSLNSINLSSFNTPNLKIMSNMFSGCKNLTSIDLSNFDTSNVTNMSGMFGNCSKIKVLDISSFNTINVQYMGGMFGGDTNLQFVKISEGWNTDKVFDSSGMFSQCNSIVGMNGTKYSNENTDKRYARLDLEDVPGYFWNYIDNSHISIANDVTNLSLLNGKDSIVELSWNENEYATGYEVYRSTDNKKWSKISTININEYTDSGLKYGVKYYYKIRPYNLTSKGIYSNVVNKTIKPNRVNLKYSSGSTNNIKISWDKVSTTGYEIYRSTDNKKWSKIKTITKNSTLSFNNTKLKANKIYYYKLRAYKTVSGKKVYGSFSAVLKIRTAPVKPTFSVSYKDYNALNLNIGGVSGVTTYYIHQSMDGKTYTHLTSLTAKGVLAQEDLEVGKTYYYRLRACNSYNVCSGWVYANRKVTTKTPGFSLSTSSKKVTIKLNSVNMADGYEIYRSTSKKGKYTLVKAFTKDDELLFNNGTKKGYTYYYKVRSYILVNEKKVYSPFSGIKSIKSK